MGNYTGLRLKCNVKPEFRAEIGKLMNSTLEWKDFSHPVMQEFGKFYRSEFIPFGALSYMPDSWGGDVKFDKNGIPVVDSDGHLVFNESAVERSYNEDTGFWSFQCSLKNYEGEIDFFIDKVIPVLCDSVEFCERYYEEDAYSTFYMLSDGKMYDGKGCQYRDDDDFI